MQNINKDYKIVLYVTDSENDKFIFDKVKKHFNDCHVCKNVKDLCRHLVNQSVPKVILMTGDSLEHSMFAYYRAIDAVADYTLCDHKVVALVPLKYESDAFDAHRCNAIDDYLVSRPLYESNRIILICEHLLIELGVSLPFMQQRNITQRLQDNTSPEFLALMNKLLESKESIEQNFKKSVAEIDNALDGAAIKIQQHQNASLDLVKLKETLAKIKSDDIRPSLIKLQEKAIGLLNSAISFEPPVENEEQDVPDEHPEPMFNRLYQQDIQNDAASEKQRTIPKVLLVEDDVISQQLTLRILKSLNINTEIAVSGRRALASLNSIKYDLVLMDVNLPDTNGIYIVAQTRGEDHLNHDTPIIMLTGNKQKETVANAVKNGAKGYIVKPIRKSTIQQLLDKHVG